jgi:hypothetical protein
MPRPDAAAAGPVLRLTHRDRQTTALAALPGKYELQTAAGETRQLTIAAVPPPQVLAGPWEVGFAAGWGAPEQTTFASLTDWTAHPDPAIKHFSGTAIYRKSFKVAPSQPPGLRTQTFLDLGEVRDLASVRLNGNDLGTLWLPPYQVDITSALIPGENQLEVAVVNPWNNRLLGDASLPPVRRRTYLQAPAAFNNNAPLLPAGWIGPAVLRHAVASDNIQPTP